MEFTTWYPWLLSGLSMVSLYLITQKKSVGMLLGVFNQFFWFYFAYKTKTYGFVPSTCCYLVLSTRGFINWRRAERKSS